MHSLSNIVRQLCCAIFLQSMFIFVFLLIWYFVKGAKPVQNLTSANIIYLESRKLICSILLCLLPFCYKDPLESE